MGKAPELIIFDWDGTLMDSVGQIVSSMQNSATAVGLPVPEAHAVRDIIGLSLQPAITRLFGELPATSLNGFLEQYRREYVELNPTPTPFFANSLTTLGLLRNNGHKLAVATGKMRRGLIAFGSKLKPGIILMVPVVPMKASLSQVRKCYWTYWTSFS